MKGPVHVTVQMATMVLPVKVSTLHVVQLVMHFVCSRCDLVVGGPAITPPVHFTRNSIIHGYIPMGNKNLLSIKWAWTAG